MERKDKTFYNGGSEFIPRDESEALRLQAEKIKHFVYGDRDFRETVLLGVSKANSTAETVIRSALEGFPDLLTEGQTSFLKENPSNDPSNKQLIYLRVSLSSPLKLTESERLTERYKLLDNFDDDFPKDVIESDKPDKLDAIEAEMAVEDAVVGLIKISDFKDARIIISMLNKISAEEVQDNIDNSTLECSMWLALAQLSLAHGLDLSELSPEQIQKHLKSRDFELLMSLGYLGFVSKDKLSALPPQKRIAVMNGMKLSGEVADDSDPNSLFKDEVTKHTAKSFIKTASGEANLNIAKAELIKEIGGNCDLTIVGRLLKGLIENGDEESKEIAVELFQREDLPEHFRVYIARKLCDSGHWSRQIIQHFREYRIQGGNGIRIEALSAIIKQMHLTPSLELYKVLEQTRVTHGSEALNEVAEFGRKVFRLTNIDIKGKLEIFSAWAKRINNGDIDIDHLGTLNQSLHEVSMGIEKFWIASKTDSRYTLINSQLQKILLDSTIFSHPENPVLYLKRGIMPTSVLLEFAKGNDNLEESLAQLEQATEDGHFDPRNLVQRDLEYQRYLKMVNNPKWAEDPYQKFQELQFIGDRVPERELNLQEGMESEALVYEAAYFYWLVKSRVDMGRKVSVVGNRRYGDYFVTDVLRRDLEELGVQVSSYKIGSSGIREKEVYDVFPDSFIQGISRETPDIIIVDGTPNATTRDNSARLPSAMVGYDEWFSIYNEAVGADLEDMDLPKNARGDLIKKIVVSEPAVPYKIAYWSPMEFTKVTLGNSQKSLPNEMPDTENPVVILTNPVIVPDKFKGFPKHLEGHKPGFFDDPEKYIRGEKEIVFDTNGVREWVKDGLGEDEYVNLVQNRMIRILPRILRETNPLFQ